MKNILVALDMKPTDAILLDSGHLPCGKMWFKDLDGACGFAGSRFCWI